MSVPQAAPTRRMQWFAAMSCSLPTGASVASVEEEAEEKIAEKAVPEEKAAVMVPEAVAVVALAEAEAAEASAAELTVKASANAQKLTIDQMVCASVFGFFGVTISRATVLPFAL